MSTYAAVQATIWRDEDWRALTKPAQHLYLLLLSQPTRSACGLLPIQHRKWSAMCSGDSIEDVQRALMELQAARYVLVDYSTDEVLIRSFMRHDGGYRNEFKNRVAVLKAIEAVESTVLRRWLTAEIARLIAAPKEQVKADAIGDGISDQIDDAIGDGIPTTITTTSTIIQLPVIQSPLPKSSRTTLSSQDVEPVGILLDQPTETDENNNEPFWIESTEQTEPETQPRPEREYPPDMPEADHQARINAVCASFAEMCIKNNPGKIGNPKALKASKQAEARANPNVTLWTRQFPTAHPDEIASWIHDGKTPSNHKRVLNSADRDEQEYNRARAERKAIADAQAKATQDAEIDTCRANFTGWRDRVPQGSNRHNPISRAAQ